MSEDQVDLEALSRGDKRAWDGFVRRYARVVFAAVQNRLGRAGRPEDVDEVAQDVFLRLCKSDYRLLRQYDPARAALSTWLTVIAGSAAIDHLRRRRPPELALEAVPEDRLAEELRLPVRVRIPRRPALAAPGSGPRAALPPRSGGRRRGGDHGVDRQTVRSMHHKALAKLRAHFGRDDTKYGG